MELNPGDFVESIRGRDQGRIYLIKSIENGYAHLVDGKYRQLDNPKKKKLKHIKFIGQNSALLKEKLINNQKILNSEVRKTITNLNII